MVKKTGIWSSHWFITFFTFFRSLSLERNPASTYGLRIELGHLALDNIPLPSLLLVAFSGFFFEATTHTKIRRRNKHSTVTQSKQTGVTIEPSL